jgi:ionotropic glutamate receptor
MPTLADPLLADFSSLAAKLASGVWWICAMLVISMYIGNYVAIRMKNRISSPIISPWDLVDRTNVQYGILSEGSTYDFLKVTIMRVIISYTT